MRRFLTAVLALALFASPAVAKQPRCPLPMDQCLAHFTRMHERPWLGVELEPDSVTHMPIIRRLVPGGPAERAGVHVGDRIQKLGGLEAGEFFAGKAGWKDAPQTPLAVLRDGKVHPLQLPNMPMPDDVFARILGEHMLEGHLAYAHGAAHPEEPEHR